MRIALVGMAITSLLACNRPLFTPRPDAAVPLRAGDPRQALVGAWAVEFALDSLRSYEAGPAWVRLSHPAVVRGTLRLADTSVGHTPARGLRAELTVDFTPLLGRQMSCYAPGAGTVALDPSGAEWRLWFTPGAGDCGFGGSGRLVADTLQGTWSESSYIGSAAEGRFRMVRRPR